MQSNKGIMDRLRARLDHRSTHSGGRQKSGVITVDQERTGALVSVNVYDMMWLNVYTDSLGIGVYHTGVVVYGTEYCYGGHPLSYSGIFAMIPQDTETLGPNYSHKSTLELGYTDFTEPDVALILEGLGPQYRGDQYHLLHRNCNHFTNSLVQILCGVSLPKWINRLAGVGAKLPFVERTIPKVWLTPRPLYESEQELEHNLPSIDVGSHSCPILVSENLHQRRSSDAHHSELPLPPSSSSRSKPPTQRRPHSTTITPTRSSSGSSTGAPSSTSLSKRFRDSMYFSGRRSSAQTKPASAGQNSESPSSTKHRSSVLSGRSGQNETPIVQHRPSTASSPANTPSLGDSSSGSRSETSSDSSQRRGSFVNRLSHPFVNFLTPRRPSSVYLCPDAESRLSSRVSVTQQPGELHLFPAEDGQFTNLLDTMSPTRRPSDGPLSPVNRQLRSIAGTPPLFRKRYSAPMNRKSCVSSDCTGALTNGLLTRLQVLCGGSGNTHDGASSSQSNECHGRRSGEHKLSNGF